MFLLRKAKVRIPGNKLD